MEAAENADLAVVFAGTNGEFESEGFDRFDMSLSKGQDELVERVAAAYKRTIVVNFSAAPILLPWRDNVAAIVQAWFPRQECGNAVTDLVLGKVDACGRLPTTFPFKIEYNPSYGTSPGMRMNEINYAEGVFVGYRQYDYNHIPPCWPFGFTTFAWSHFKLSSSMNPFGTIELSVQVTNTGNRDGKEVVQVYIHQLRPNHLRPHKELHAF